MKHEEIKEVFSDLEIKNPDLKGKGVREENWFGRIIYLSEMYFVLYSDRKRELSKSQLAAYKGIQDLPDQLKFRKLIEFNGKMPDFNPNINPMTGRELIEEAERGYIPVFDQFFDKSHKVTLFPLDGFDFWFENSKFLNLESE